jgi:protein-L-isoaspartate(D-aspartate) O-methyltransferase
VLEVGTGSGYQAAVLSRVVDRVYSIEIVPELAGDAAARLARLGYDNVETRLGDGYNGWAEEAPFDGILVTAAAPAVPPPLVEQLREGARLVIPVGVPYGHQELKVVEKEADGSVTTSRVLGVAFVPLTRTTSSADSG